MPNDKSSGNDDPTKEFFETFWSEVKKPFLSCVLHSFHKRNSTPHKDKLLLN